MCLKEILQELDASSVMKGEDENPSVVEGLRIKKR